MTADARHLPSHQCELRARGSGLEIVLLVLGSVLLTRAAPWVRELVIRYVDARDGDTDSLVCSEATDTDTR
ncbi:hypothetical protein [Pseudonocardia sp.]|jgi:hypothetical protein|uniref:hypothetical protein n=1 Tax=Pseudonocardia sp. TaxID=60912 RepID=UPI002636E34C|nr:hypothetical protein [Pseudonocardia sp.]MCW2722068.1 hypothetical protein [Pseudonocardia sp.]MDT7618151.1 hypothetical protein [Pseudonocardiales bacterium]